MRILQSLYDGGGGVPPQLAITRRLIEHGHEVRVLAHETLRRRVEERGATFTPFRDTLPGHDMTSRETDTIRDWEPADPLEGAERFRDMVLFGPALANAREVLALLAEWPAEAILLDWLLFGTALAAEYAKLPAVVLVHMPYPMRTGPGPGDEFFAPGLATMNDTRAEFGLAPVEHWDQQLLNCAAVCVLTVPELDPASGFELPVNVHFVGTAIEPASIDWESPWTEPNGYPLVLISFSTTFMDQTDLAGRVLAAVADLPIRVLFTTGPSLRVDGLAIPANVTVTPYMPHGAVLPQVALVITHAGFGTIQESLSAGVPMVCLPTGRDQPANAARIAELGLGLAISPTSTPEEIRASVVEALASPQLRTKAERMSRMLRRQDGISAVVEQIEGLG